MALDSNPPFGYLARRRETLAGEGLVFPLLDWIVLGILIRQGFSAEVPVRVFRAPQSRRQVQWVRPFPGG